MSFTKLHPQKPNPRAKGTILGYKPFIHHKNTQVQESGSNFSKYSEKLSEVQKLTETVQYTLLNYKQQAANLSLKNKAISSENVLLRQKIKIIQSSIPKSKPLELFSPSNTSIPTQETEIFLSKNSNFSVSSCSSIDSIKVLKDQVDHIKEFKHTKKLEAKVTMHKKSNSIDHSDKPPKSSPNPKKTIKYLPIEPKYSQSFTHKLLHNALLCKIPVLRFN